jgi:alpha-tubulin suppressor-like RCC1 family protein
MKPDGTLRCWGYNAQNQLGNGTTTTAITPVDRAGLSGAMEMAFGYRHLCARMRDGTVRCWGQGNEGQLGNNLGTNSGNTPVTVSNLNNVMQLACGS